jgi:hypothetical protein
MTPAPSPRTLFGNPVRPAIEASSARGTSATDLCAARSLLAAELDLLTMRGFRISRPLGLHRSLMIVVGRTDVKGASIPIGEVCLHGVGRAAAAVQAAFRGRLRTAHRPLRLASSIGSVKTNRLPRPLSFSTQIRPPCSSTRRFESASPSPVPSEAVALALASLATAGASADSGL